jgi:hypothetical protein
MTVKDLKTFLESLPDDLPIFRENGEFNGDFRRVEKASANLAPTFGLPQGLILQ